ncbi:transposase [Facklamia miroungae]
MSKKYAYELKIKVVEEYIEGKLGYKALTKKYGISSPSLVKNWVYNYKRYCTNGLKAIQGKADYSLDFKLNVLHFKQRIGASYKETAIAFNLTNPSMIANWKRIYLEGGSEALNRPIGRPPKVVKKLNKKELRQKNKVTDDSELERVRQQVTYLEIENAYLKKLKEWGLNDHRDPNKPNSL